MYPPFDYMRDLEKISRTTTDFIGPCHRVLRFPNSCREGQEQVSILTAYPINAVEGHDSSRKSLQQVCLVYKHGVMVGRHCKTATWERSSYIRREHGKLERTRDFEIKGRKFRKFYLKFNPTCDPPKSSEYPPPVPLKMFVDALEISNVSGAKRVRTKANVTGEAGLCRFSLFSVTSFNW